MKRPLISILLAAILLTGGIGERSLWAAEAPAADEILIEEGSEAEQEETADSLQTESADSAERQVLVYSYPTDYPNDHVNTGDQAADIVAVAQTQIGYTEETENHTKYGYWYLGADEELSWCGVFIAWCADQAGIPTSIIARSGIASGYSVSNMADNSFQCPALAFGETEAKAGDIIYVDNDGDDISNHVGLVEAVDDTYIYTIEGNSSDQVSEVRYLVSTGYRALTASVSTTAHIVFYARPAYEGGSTTDPAEEEQETGTLYTVTVASSLNVRAEADYSSSALGSLSNGTTVEVFETVTGPAGSDGSTGLWGRITYEGQTGWIYMKYTQPVDTTITVNRVAGANRYTTAIETANQLLTVSGRSAFDAVVVACADNYPDALAGATLAGEYKAPILLAGKSSSGNADTIEYIEQSLTPGGQIYILGGTSAVPSSVETTLESAGYSITRLAGTDRYGTNLKIVSACGISSGSAAFVVNGYSSFADALTIGAVAAGMGAPIYLASSSGLNTDQLNDLVSHAPSTVYIIGGTSAVSSSVETQLSNKGLLSERVYGSNRYETAVAVAEKFQLTSSGSAVIASGTAFPDGLVSEVLAAELGSPILLVSESCTADTADFISSCGVSALYVMGGTSAVSEAVVEALTE